MASLKPQNPLVVVVGATGTGKSQLAVDLAKRFNGEIINGDAMQLYHGLPIITNKIKPEEQQGIPHHLLGQISLREEPWTVQKFVANAVKTIHDIHDRNKLPVLVGGTHYYLQSLLFADSLVNEQAHQQFSIESKNDSDRAWPILDASTEAMFNELKRIDPAMARRWHPNDRRKIRRSLEIFLQTGQRASDVYEQQQSHVPGTVGHESDEDHELVQSQSLRYPTLILWTNVPREHLHSRLDRRIDQMIEDGLLKEARSLYDTYQNFIDAGDALNETKGIWVSIGYKEFLPYFNAVASRRSQEQQDSLFSACVERTKVATRQYSKRQVRWLRIKLRNAMRKVDTCSIFVLDAGELSAWASNVEQPAAELTESFLKGANLLDSDEKSNLALDTCEQMSEHQQGLGRKQMQTRTCEICGVTAGTAAQWHQHEQSRRHKNTLKAKTKKSITQD
ncbi:MAG: hypothetical protein Q9162_003207 [Coniocarpon cinnabarinum]